MRKQFACILFLLLLPIAYATQYGSKFYDGGIYGGDIISPIIELLSPADDATSTDGTPELSYNVTDNSGSIANCTLFIDGRANITDSIISLATTQAFTPASNLSEGTHQWNIRCIDQSSNAVTATSSRTITINATSDPEGPPPEIIDILSPNVTLLSPATGSSTSDTTPSFSFNAADESGSVANCTLFIDSANDTVTTTAISGSTAQISPRSPLQTGDHEWNIRCIDESNNANTAPESFTITITGGGSNGGGGGGGGGGGAVIAKTYSLQSSRQSFGLLRGDRITFNHTDGQHTVTLLEIVAQDAKLRIASTPQEITLSAGKTRDLSIDDDTIPDIRIIAGAVQYPQANITVERLAPIAVPTSGEDLQAIDTPSLADNNPAARGTITNTNPMDDQEADASKDRHIWQWGILGLVIIGIITAALVKRKGLETNPLITFIKQSRAQGHTPEEIAQSLISHGWPQQLVTEGFAKAGLNAPSGPIPLRPVQLTTDHPHDPLHEYVATQIRKGRSPIQIRQTLLEAGWRPKDISAVIKEYERR